MRLSQDKLNVKNKTRSNPFNWRGQFTPEFVDYIIESFTNPDDIVVDPFSGSGTVLLECSRKKLGCYGFEINPAAFVMSKFFSFANLPMEARMRLLSTLEKKISALTADFHDLPLFQHGRAYRESYKNLLDFSAALLPKIEEAEERVIALNTLFICENKKDSSLGHSIVASFDYIRKVLLCLPYTNRKISEGLGDARLVHVNCPAKANVIFTSPPYINVFNYHQNHRAILETLGWDMLRVARSEIGSNRKNRSNRFRTVVQYCLDMEQVLESFWRCLEDNGLIVLVIGKESNVRKVQFYNGYIVKKIVEGIGGYESTTNYERAFLNKFGKNIKEDIIVMRKDISPPSASKAKEIAIEHLESSLSLAPREVQQDILDAISSVDSITPSPLFRCNWENI